MVTATPSRGESEQNQPEDGTHQNGTAARSRSCSGPQRRSGRGIVQGGVGLTARVEGACNRAHSFGNAALDALGLPHDRVG